MQFGAGVGEAAKYHMRQCGRSRERIDVGPERDARRALGGEPIDARRDRRKGHRGKFMLAGKARSSGDSRRRADHPHRGCRYSKPVQPHGSRAGLKPIAFGDLGFAGLAAVEHPAFGQKFWPGGSMDRTIDAAPAQQRRIGRVDDGVNAQCGDVGNDDFQPRLADPARKPPQADAAALRVTPLSANSCCSSPAWNISRMMSQPPTNSPLT